MIEYDEVWDEEGKLLDRRERMVPEEEVLRAEAEKRLKGLPPGAFASPLGQIVKDILTVLRLEELT